MDKRVLFSAVNTVLLIALIAETVSAQVPQPQQQSQPVPQPQQQSQGGVLHSGFTATLLDNFTTFAVPKSQPQPQLFPNHPEEIPIEILTQSPLQTAENIPTPLPTPPTIIFTNDPTVRGRLLTAEEGCGYSNVTEYRHVVGGNPAKPGKYPWMVLIGYRNSEGELFTKCGGSLITTRHVLTAAHCILSTLSFARLGEHDISSTTDGDVEDINVVRVERHPDYNRRDKTNDIALLYLERDVNMTFDESIRTRSFIGYNPFIAGWGRLQEGGNSSNVLQELQLPILDNAECKEQYRKQGKLLSDVQFTDAIICAGRLSGGQDGCQGDSGGPLMIAIDSAIPPAAVDFRFHQIGVISYGIGCARTDTPGIYSSVPHFLDWIQEKIKQHPI